MQKGSLSILVVLYAAGFIAAFNENIVNVILVDVMNVYSVSSTTAQWLVTGYMIVTALVVAVMAFLMRRFSVRTLLLGGVCLLFGGSVGAFFAPTFALLLVFRLIQAMGSGVFITLMMTNVLILAPKPKIGTFMAIGSCCITFGPALAPVASGAMVVAFGWRYVFALTAVIIAIIGIVGFFLVRTPAKKEQAKLDVLSVVLSGLGLTALVYGLTSVMSELTVGMISLCVGLVLLVMFVLRQHRISNPMLHLAPFEQRDFVLACLLSVVAMMTTFSMSVILILYFQTSLGMDAFAAGALLLIPILFNAFTAMIGGRVMDKRGPMPLLPLGFAVIVLGQSVIALTATQLSMVIVVVGSVITYGGVGLVFSPAQTAGLSRLENKLHGSGVAIMNLFIQIAACIGPALFVGVMSATADSGISLGQANEFAQAQGFSYAVWVSAALALVAIVVSLPLARSVQAKQNETKRVVTAVSPSVNKAKTAISSSDVSSNSPASVAEIKVAALMKRDVYVATADATVGEVVDLLVKQKTSGMPLVNSRNEVVGFVSDGDILRTLSGGEQRAPLSSGEALWMMLLNTQVQDNLSELKSSKALDIATRSVVCVSAESDLNEVCRLLASHQIKKLPVVKGNKLVGTISRSDVMRYVLSA